jgi:signal transduction histidine kinase
MSVILAVSLSLISAFKASQNVRASALDIGIQVTNDFAQHSSFSLISETKENAKGAIKSALGFENVLLVSIFSPDGTEFISDQKEGVTPSNYDIKQAPESAELVSEYSDYWVFASAVYKKADTDENKFNEGGEDEFFDTDFDDGDGSPKLLGYVLVEYNKERLHALQRSMFINNFTIGAIIVGLLMLFIRWGVDRLVQPLTSLSKSMAHARDSGTYPQVPIEGAREIRQMADVYNQMMRQLKRQRDELELHRDNLESEVEVRTQELVVARDQALTSNRHKSEFLANMSHELRTPLQAIIGYADLTREDLELECMDDQAEDLVKIIRSANNLLGLINNILDLSKIEAGRMELSPTSVDMHDLIDETIDTIKPMADTNGNKLVVEQSELPSALFLDRQKMMQIFLNLLSNACKFTNNGTITFALHTDESRLHFSVADTGVGIPQDKLEVIFEEFIQVDGSLSRNFEGTGLGMAITKSFCDLMQGEISVESELDKGTIFKVWLPLLKNQEVSE